MSSIPPPTGPVQPGGPAPSGPLPGGPPTAKPQPATMAPSQREGQSIEPSTQGAPPPPTVPDDAAIVLSSVSKSFGPLVAVSEVSLAVSPGVTALLGPNGAGKSTLIRLICGLAKPSGGHVWVAGGNPRRDQAVRGRIGLVPQQDRLFERATALETVVLAATLSKVSDPEAAARRALEAVDLDPDLDRGVGKYSKGMRQRVKIAQALAHNPAVIVLDEPLSGLDPVQRRAMITLFHTLGEQGRTVLVSSHVLDEVERFGSNIVVMARGRLAAEGDFRQIRSMMDSQPNRIRVRCSDARRLTTALIASGQVSGCTIASSTEVELTTETVPGFRLVLPQISRDHRIRLDEVLPLDDDLESVFHYLLGGVGS